METTTKSSKKGEFSFENKKLILYISLIILAGILFIFAGYINIGFNNLLSNFNIVISGITIPKLSVIIAPIVEEIIKLVGYGILFLFSVKLISILGYKSKKDFLNNNLIVAFIISAGVFGFIEGAEHNPGVSFYYFYGFVFLNTLIHITYSIYPFIFGRKYGNCFICFLPIAILLHSVHNFMIDVVWNNKWVTFAVVTIFLAPLLVLERKNLFSPVEKFMLPRKIKDKRKANVILSLAFILIHIYIFLCCLLAF